MFSNPTVDSVIKDFLDTAAKLEQLVTVHNAKSLDHKAQADRLIDLSQEFANEAARAAKISENIRSLVQ